MGNVHLVSDQAGAAAGQAEDRRLLQVVGDIARPAAQRKPFVTIDLRVKQSFARLIKLQKIAQTALGKIYPLAMLIFAVVTNQAVSLAQFDNLQNFSILPFDLVTIAKTHPRQRRVSTRIDTGFTSRREDDTDRTMLKLDDHTETQLKFGGTNPALADDKILHISNNRQKRARL